MIDKASGGHIRAVLRQYGRVIWIEPFHSKTRKEAHEKARVKAFEMNEAKKAGAKE